MKKKTLNWNEIQKYYDENHTWREVVKYFETSTKTLSIAKKNGLFKTRTISEANVLANKLHPKTLSEKTKKKISESRKKYLIKNPDKVPYKLNHYSKGSSYPENYFNYIFKKYNLEFIKELPISYYSLDFAFNGKINVEIDGEQHYLDKRILNSNGNRDIFLQNLGWETIRIRWSYYQKLSKKEKQIFIEKLINYINNCETKFNVSDLLKEKKYYCSDCGVEITKHSKTGYCIKCVNKRYRKSKRPPYEQLKNEIKISNYSAIGRKYGVSDNAIRKWILNYEKNINNETCSVCNVILTGKGKTNLCHSCYSKRNRKVERPQKEQLLLEIEVLGYLATGRKYGVSDNAIRKWIK